MTAPKSTALVLLLLVTGASGAAERDLAEAAMLALERDPQFAAARWQRQADREKLPQARSLFLPKVQLEAGAERVKEEADYGSSLSPLAQDREFETDNTSIGVGLTQPLFRAESFTLYKQAQVILDSADLRLAAAKQGLLLRVSEAYFAVLEAQENLRSFQSEARAAETLRDRAQRALEVGAGTISDVHNAQARYDLTQARLIGSRNELQLAREQLRRLIGAVPGELAGLVEGFQPLDIAPEQAEPWVEQAQRNNLQVRLQDTAWQLARDEVSRQRAQRYPKVDLVARYGRSDQDRTTFGPELAATQRSVGVQLSVPLFTGGAVSSQIREAAYEREAAMEQLQDARRAAALNAETALLSLQASGRQVRALEQALESSRTTEASTERGRELGLYTALDVLNAQRDRYATERDLATARYRHLLAFLQLKAAVGELDADAIAAVNRYLD